MQLNFLVGALALLVPTALAGCESGLNHNLGTSCHDAYTNSACSSASRAYVLYCQKNGLWGKGATCQKGYGCHNCVCTKGWENPGKRMLEDAAEGFESEE